ncbi:MAG: DNA repair protein RadA [Kribbellaceae bacterium]|nr:DNA repair protein RadA [Kribbellaceae bacterium]
MAKAAAKTGRSPYQCGECGWTTARWIGRCGECQAWGSVVEIGAPKASRVTAGPVSSPATPIAQVSAVEAASRSTGLAELDRVLGGGMVPGAVVLLAGEPGVGKSTLLLEVAARSARSGQRTLYVSGEESAAQVRLRAGRTDALVDELFLASETDLSAVVGQVDAVKPGLLVVDSVQTIAHPEVDGAPGGVTQVREVTGALVRLAKERNIAVVLVGHVTKDGAIAGPRMLEHLVDVVLAFDGDRHSGFRMVRATKNRFGPADEVGCFDLVDTGIVEVTDPTGLFVSRHTEPVPGTCVTVMMEGRRPLLAEVQALVGPSNAPQPRRTTSGLESSRVAMVLAVLGSRVGIRLNDQEVYVATVGGVRINEPVVDLSVAIAVASSACGMAAHPGLVAIGEVGLAGEVRRVGGLEKRLAEAARLGFTKAIIPAEVPNWSREMKPIDIQSKYGLKVYPAADIGNALLAAGING